MGGITLCTATDFETRISHAERLIMSTLTAIVLQGGGALGAYEFGALKALFERPDFRPHVITGVSIGALSAAVLAGARRDPIATLGVMWERFSVSSLPAVSPPMVRSRVSMTSPALLLLSISACRA